MKKNQENGIRLSLNAISLSREAIVEEENVIRINPTYACHFGGANMNGEIVTKDSFDKMFKAMAESDGAIMPSINWMHSDTIIGTWTDLTPDDKGLLVSGYLAKTWDVENRIMPLVRAGIPLYLSTEGFVDLNGIEWMEDGTYVAKAFDLVRISIVDIPADFQQSEVLRNAISLHRERRVNKAEAEEEKPNETEIKHKPFIY